MTRTTPCQPGFLPRSKIEPGSKWSWLRGDESYFPSYKAGDYRTLLADNWKSARALCLGISEQGKLMSTLRLTWTAGVRSWSHARVLCVGRYARDDGEFAFGRRVWKGIEREDSLVILLQGTVGAKGQWVISFPCILLDVCFRSASYTRWVFFNIEVL